MSQRCQKRSCPLPPSRLVDVALPSSRPSRTCRSPLFWRHADAIGGHRTIKNDNPFFRRPPIAPRAAAGVPRARPPNQGGSVKENSDELRLFVGSFGL